MRRRWAWCPRDRREDPRGPSPGWRGLQGRAQPGARLRSGRRRRRVRRGPRCSRSGEVGTHNAQTGGGLSPFSSFFFFFWRARSAELLDTFQNVPGIAWAGEGARECGPAPRPPTLATAFQPGAGLHWLQTPRAWLQVSASAPRGAEPPGRARSPRSPRCPSSLHTEEAELPGLERTCASSWRTLLGGGADHPVGSYSSLPPLSALAPLAPEARGWQTPTPGNGFFLT